MRPTPALHPAATGRPTPVPHVPSAPSVADDRDALVRAALLDAARRCSLHSAAHLIPTATTHAAWMAIALDFVVTYTHRTSLRSVAIPAAEAAERLAPGDLDGAVTQFARSCGLSAEAWLANARAEQGR